MDYKSKGAKVEFGGSELFEQKTKRAARYLPRHQPGMQQAERKLFEQLRPSARGVEMTVAARPYGFRTDLGNTSAFKELDPIPQFKATAKLGGFLEARFSGSF